MDARNGILMQQKVDAFELAYKEEFGDSLNGYESFKAFVMMNLASAKYFAYNNMFALTHQRYQEVADRMGGFRKSRSFNKEQKAGVTALFDELEKVHKATPERHQNLVVGRMDTRCCLCRTMPANKTGSQMVSIFLAHPSFSWDGKGRRFHEALNHDFLNASEMNCTFYGRDIPDWRFAKVEGKEEVTEEDIEKNINQLEYDNEFCSRCEDRFGVLESAYSQYYNGQKRMINPRVSYLFWLSVLWRMSIGSISIFMDMNDELPLRKLLDDNVQDVLKDIEGGGDSDLGEWRYAIFRAEGLREGDKGVLGYRKECSPYIVMYNDLVMIFFHKEPTDVELNMDPINVQREMLNDWHNSEKSTRVDRRWFWNVRDWFVESSYDFYDSVREKALRIIREKERSEDRVIDDKTKAEAIKVARLKMGLQEKQFRLRKLERITAAWLRKHKAEEKGEVYNPLNDEELFLQQRDFDMYYQDLAALSRYEGGQDKIPLFPFYEQARQAIPDEREWAFAEDDEKDVAFRDAMNDYFGNLSPQELDQMINGVQEPYINPYAGVRRNDPCPCGSGKKFKHCHGKQ